MTLKDFLNEGDKFAKYIGIDLIEVKPGTAKATMTVTENHMNAGNICQGGALFTLADLVFAALVNQGDNMAFAINSTIYYHVSAKLGDVLTAETDATDLVYELYRDNVKIDSATESTYTLTTADLSKAISVKVYQTKD